MSRRSTDESLRKPRILKGTPMQKYINMFALGITALGGISWYLLELWPQSRNVLSNIKEGKFDDSPDTKYRLQSMKYLLSDPSYFDLIVKLQKRTYEKESGQKEKPWYVKALSTTTTDDEM